MRWLVRVLTVQVQSLIAAFQFLSIVPIRVAVPFTPPVLARSVVYYPVVGAFIGLALGAAAAALNAALPVWPAAALLLALWVALSGALHLDGWMDTADGLLSRRSRERALEIMRDSRVGALGAAAGMLLLLTKAAALASLLQTEGGRVWLPLLLAAVWGRWWMTQAIASWPYARGDGGAEGGESAAGLGGLFREVRWRHAASAGAAALAVTALGAYAGAGSDAYGGRIWEPLALAAAVPLAAALAGWLAANAISRRLGGLTGDTYGAMNEGIELAILLVWIAARHGGMLG